MIVKKENKKNIGDIGYGLVEQEWGKGFGYQALKAIVDWAILQESVKIIKAECLIDNKSSARILEKVGMSEVKREKRVSLLATYEILRYGAIII